MRLWTLHPRYLDRSGLLALWREGLLAQVVLLGRTRGYLHHPQLVRFREHRSPLAAMAGYLQVVYKESVRRDYRFDRTRIRRRGGKERIPETRGQLLYEWHHLKAKLRKRSPRYFFKIRQITDPEPHPLFKIISGKVRDWEKRTRHPKMLG